MASPAGGVREDDAKAAAAALARLGDALRCTEIAGSTTNLAFLAALAADADFASGDVDTGLIGRKQDELTKPIVPDPRAIASAALAAADNRSALAPSDDPWSTLAGYAHFHPLARQVSLKHGETEIGAEVTALDGHHASVTLAGHDAILLDARRAPRTAQWAGHLTVFDQAGTFAFLVSDPFERAAEATAGGDAIRAPMPGLVKLSRAAKGDAVVKGQPLLILEAMKMEHSITAPHDAIIAEIVSEGAQVSDGTILVRFETVPAAEGAG